MGISEIGICVTIVISIISLIFSIVGWWGNKPKLKIEIVDKKWDCFFGTTINREFRLKRSIAGARISIVNNSPVAITISDVKLIIKKEKYRLIDKNIKYWKDVEFFFKDDLGNLGTDGTGIDYVKTGLSVPIKINPYDAIITHVLFHDFPLKYKNRCKGKIVMYSAVGKINKRINMKEYDKRFLEIFDQEYQQYLNSTEYSNQPKE